MFNFLLVIATLIGSSLSVRLRYYKAPKMGDTELCYNLDNSDLVRFIDGVIRRATPKIISMHVLIIMRNGIGMTPRNYVIDAWYPLNVSSKSVIKISSLTFKISGLMNKIRKELGNDIETATIRILVNEVGEWYFSDFVNINGRTHHPLSLRRDVTQRMINHRNRMHGMYNMPRIVRVYKEKEKKKKTVQMNDTLDVMPPPVMDETTATPKTPSVPLLEFKSNERCSLSEVPWSESTRPSVHSRDSDDYSIDDSGESVVSVPLTGVECARVPAMSKMLWMAVLFTVINVALSSKLEYAQWRIPMVGDKELCYVLDFNPIQYGKIRTIVYSMHVLTIKRNHIGVYTPNNRRNVIDSWYQLNAASKSVMKANTLTFKIAGLMKRVRKELGSDIESATIRLLVEDRARVLSEWHISDFVTINRRGVHPWTLCNAVTPRSGARSTRSRSNTPSSRPKTAERRSRSAQLQVRSPEVPLLRLKKIGEGKRKKL